MILLLEQFSCEAVTRGWEQGAAAAAAAERVARHAPRCTKIDPSGSEFKSRQHTKSQYIPKKQKARFIDVTKIGMQKVLKT
jgi:hypothetical protein